MTPCQQLPSKCSLPSIVSLCTASIIILTFRVPWRPLLTQQKMTLCRTGRPYKNVERTGKWISEEGTRSIFYEANIHDTNIKSTLLDKANNEIISNSKNSRNRRTWKSERRQICSILRSEAQNSCLQGCIDYLPTTLFNYPSTFHKFSICCSREALI